MGDEALIAAGWREALTFGFLAAAIVALWLPQIAMVERLASPARLALRPSGALLTAALACALAFGHVRPVALPFVALLGLLSAAAARPAATRFRRAAFSNRERNRSGRTMLPRLAPCGSPSP